MADQGRAGEVRCGVCGFSDRCLCWDQPAWVFFGGPILFFVIVIGGALAAVL